ncbi:MAG: T9SS type A sorting domain-containing protein [Flavobacteriales bacterium]|nr:T9SS type A sorting domain-containing protein [Flavobacteriales bacterium]
MKLRKNQLLRYFILLFGAFMLCPLQTTTAQPVELEWAASMGGALGNDQGNSVILDASGNVYVTGRFKGTADFDPGVGIYNLTSNGDFDVFILKLDALGNFLWAASVGGAGWEEGASISIDASDNVYVIGSFGGTIDFDPSVGTYDLTSSGAHDVFILKLDSQGAFLWASSMGGATSSDRGNSISNDALGNVYMTGQFDDLADFDPGVDTFNLTPVTVNASDVYVAKLDSLGSFLWAAAVGGTFSSDRGYSISNDASGNVYVTGRCSGTVDFDPGVGTYNLTANGGMDAFVLKLDSQGSFLWAATIGGVNNEIGYSISTDVSGNVYLCGVFFGTGDFDPGVGTYNLTSNGSSDVFVVKLDSLGNFRWAASLGGTGSETGMSISNDELGNLYITGMYTGTVDFDPGVGTYNLISKGLSDVFVVKLDTLGNFLWAFSMGAAVGHDYGLSVAYGASGNVHVTGRFAGTVDFDPGVGTYNLTSPNGWYDVFVSKINQSRVNGFVFSDFNINCVPENNETGLGGRRLTINPGNLIVQTNLSGYWFLDTLPPGTYTLTADTSGNWQRTCPLSQTFSVTGPNGFTQAPSFGFVSTEPCAKPDVSVNMPFMRPCFSNQNVYVQACNEIIATGVLDSAYVDMQLDSHLIVQSATLPYTSLGNNAYRFDVGTLGPGTCTYFSIACSLSCNAVLGQTLCMQANMYPADSCVFDTIPDTTLVGVSPCTLPWDQSSLIVEGLCVNDGIQFVVSNTGDPIIGDMYCYSAVRVYIDGQFILLDSVQLAGGDSIVFMFSGDGRTWRLEADQHPLHPGNSHPNATVELCGNSNNWTPDLVNIMPMDDADPITDIYCGIVRGSYDPNDKTGYPYGVTDSNNISPNQQLQYLIRFQNTGTDTAFKVVVRDTLDTNLNMFSVISGAASHNYEFTMYGPRVLQWTFDNILLPDSNTNESESHGFLTFTVDQVPNLSNGVQIRNSADIYFDFNAPVITNQTFHVVDDQLKTPQFGGTSTVTDTACGDYIFNGYTYFTSGTYIQGIVDSNGMDSVITLNLISNNTNSAITVTACGTYIAPSSIYTYTTTGTYLDTLTNSMGCDSVISINLTVNNSSSSSISLSVCNSYTSPGGSSYTTSGTYLDTLTNVSGCDSLITINLTVNNSSSSSISPTVCYSYTSPGGNTYTASGTYMDTIPNSMGCDSVIIINLTINNSSSSTISPTACNSYSSPAANTYTISGSYMDTVPNSNGCDSVITINLIVNNSTTNTISPTACESYLSPGGNVYTVSGSYTETLQNTAGCDSIITILLTINPNPTVNITGLDTGYCTKDGSITLVGTPTGGTFIGMGISGSQFDPTIAGVGTHTIMYAYTDSNNCSDSISESVNVSLCTGIEQPGIIEGLKIFPNPNTGEFTLIMSITQPENLVLKLLNNLGQEIYTERLTQFKGSYEKQFDLSEYPVGAYNLRIISNQGTIYRQVVIE